MASDCLPHQEERDARGMLGHLAFCGAPGVGKATLACRFGSILKNVGLLPSDNVVKMSGRTMQDRYLGGTQAKVNERPQSARPLTASLSASLSALLMASECMLIASRIR
jgi:hypothetical protein